jgi:serine/threonine-protein phosphatase 2A regulatory subunit B'
MDPSWTHLSVVYEFLLHLVQSAHIDTNTKKKVMDTKFINQLLRLFDSEDIREVLLLILCFLVFNCL